MRALNWGVNRRFFKAGRLGTTKAGIGVVSVSMPVTIGPQHRQQDGFTGRLRRFFGIECWISNLGF